MAVHVPRGPAEFTGRLRELAREVAPALRLHLPRPLDQAAGGLLIAYQAWFLVIVLVGGVGVLLTNAGIYAVISFTVSRRTREIGVRVALGADRGRIVVAILSPMARRVALGVVMGAPFILQLVVELSGGTWRPTPAIWGLMTAYPSQ